MDIKPFYYVKLGEKVFMTNLRSVPSLSGTRIFRDGLPEGAFNGVGFKMYEDEPVTLQQSFDSDPNGEPITHTIITALDGSILYNERTGNCTCADIDASCAPAQIVGRRSLDRFLYPDSRG